MKTLGLNISREIEMDRAWEKIGEMRKNYTIYIVHIYIYIHIYLYETQMLHVWSIFTYI